MNLELVPQQKLIIDTEKAEAELHQRLRDFVGKKVNFCPEHMKVLEYIIEMGFFSYVRELIEVKYEDDVFLRSFAQEYLVLIAHKKIMN